MLNLKQPINTTEKALAKTAVAYLKRQGFTGVGKKYWCRGKAETFQVGGIYRGIFEVAESCGGHEFPESTRDLKTCDPKSPAIYQFLGDPNVWKLIDRAHQYDDYHDIEHCDNLHRLEIGDWLVAIDYQN